MGLFSFLKSSQSGWYDMDTVEGINAIPVPAKNYRTGNDLKDCIYYVLQRKATEHKKAGRMDCAIACLRKSNELSDYEARPLLLEKDYMRLVKYIELTGDKAAAEAERNKILARHPEFLDKRISNLPRIILALEKCKRYNNDFVTISTKPSCPICGKYHLKTYSISGLSRKYPKLPSEFYTRGGFCPNCIVGIAPYFEGISTPAVASNEHIPSEIITVNGKRFDIGAYYARHPKATDKIQASKELAHTTGCPLKEAKERIDAYYNEKWKH